MNDIVSGVGEKKLIAIRNENLIADNSGNDIVVAFNQKDVNAFTIIYKKLFPSVFYYAKRFVGNEDAQDLTADVFTKLWNADKKFPSLQSIKNYLQVSVRNAAINFNEHLKIVEKNNEGIKSVNEIVLDGFNNNDEIKATHINLIIAEIDKLPVQQKKVFELYYIAGLREKEIALKLNIALRTVHNHKMAALKKIRTQLSGLYMFFSLLCFI